VTGAATSPLHGWHGLSSDASGVLLAEARAYDPATGRFLSEDALPADNLYAYAGNSPMLAGDPTGLSPTSEYGMTSGQSSARTTQICGAGSWTASFMLDTAMDIGMQAGLAVLAGQMGIYSFTTPSGERYVGRSVDIMRRLSEHMQDLTKLKGAGKVMIDIKLLTALGDAADDALPVAEQLIIDGCGGAKSTGGTLANKINAINKDRWDVLKQFDTDIDLIKSLLWP
jgi:RHS repeat-associated protein